MTGLYTYSNVVPCVDSIYKERNRLKNEKNAIQNNIKKTIDNTDEQIKKLKNKIKVLEERNKTLIIEYNKDCDKEERLRGTTPPEVKLSNISEPKIFHSSPKSRTIDVTNKEINDIKTQLNNDRFMKMIENVMNDKLNNIRNKIDLNEKERKLDDEKTKNSAICSIM